MRFAPGEIAPAGGHNADEAQRRAAEARLAADSALLSGSRIQGKVKGTAEAIEKQTKEADSASIHE